MKKLLLLVLIALFLVACGRQEIQPPSGMGMGGGNGMMQRHHTTVPNEYASLTNPVAADDASIKRGAALYTANCASCHGDGGMGDGPVATTLDPAPSAVAHTSQMMSDAYLFWRISDGGAPFQTAMPAWDATLDESARWDLINYLHALGAGTAKPASQMGGAVFDPTVQAVQQAEMLAQAVEQGVITQAEADIFAAVHNAVDEYRATHPEVTNQYADATEREAAILSALVAENVITQAQADAFTDIHDRLGVAGLMQ